MQDDNLTILEKRITYLEGPEFQDWKVREIDNRQAIYLQKAITAAELMTPDSAYESAHWLLMYKTMEEMVNGEVQEMKSIRQSFDTMPK